MEEASEICLPKCTLRDLDFILIDGKHAFPWPIIDWFYTADKLKENRTLVIDDADLASVGILKDFLVEDNNWRLINSFGERTFAFQKLNPSVLDVAWHMQPYMIRRMRREGFVGKVIRMIATLIQRSRPKRSAG